MQTNDMALALRLAMIREILEVHWRNFLGPSLTVRRL